MNEDIAKKVFQQTMDIWILPEIKKRRGKERLQKNFRLKLAQVVFSLDRGWNKIRLNEEVKAEGNFKFKVSKNKGDLVYEHEVEDIKSLKLTKADSNCAHITLFLFKNKWFISFDFRYNKKRIKEHLEAAKEFFDSARENIDKKRLRPFFDNSFSCAELIAKAILLQLPDKEILHGTEHKTRIEKFQDWANLGNVKVSYSTILKRLCSLRPSARYLCSTQFKKEDPARILNTLEDMIKFAENKNKDS